MVSLTKKGWVFCILLIIGTAFIGNIGMLFMDSMEHSMMFGVLLGGIFVLVSFSTIERYEKPANED